MTAPFLVDIIHNIPTLQPYSTYIWVLVGLAVIPSAVLWMGIMNKLSPITTLCTALLLQTIGILLPIFSQTIWSISISALLFGLTFIGIVTISTSYARQLMPGNSTKVVSYLTTVYAIGQIIGPIIAGMLTAHFHSYKIALLFAGIVVALAISLLLIGKWKIYVQYSSHKTA